MNSWRECIVDDVFEVARGGSPRPIDKFITSDLDGINWVMIGDTIQGSKYITHTKKRIIPEGLKKSRKIYPGDFLLTNSMSFGRPYISKIEGCIHDGWLVLSPREHEEIHPDFFYYLLGSPELRRVFERQAAGAVVKNLNTKIVKHTSIRLPKAIDEQRRIAAILDKADTIRRNLKQAIALADDLVKSTFLEMFGDPISNSRDWPILPLGEMLEEIRYGTSTKCQEESEEGTPVLRIPNVISERVNWDQLKYAVLPERELERLRMKNGDLLFVRSNGNPDYIGRCAVFAEDRLAVFASYLIRARFKDAAQVSPSFVSKAISMPSYRHRILIDAKTTAGNFNINTRSLKALPIICPPQERQDQFMAFQNETMKVIEVYNTDLREANDLFDSLSQRAFIGEL